MSTYRNFRAYRGGNSDRKYMKEYRGSGKKQKKIRQIIHRAINNEMKKRMKKNKKKTARRFAGFTIGRRSLVRKIHL